MTPTLLRPQRDTAITVSSVPIEFPRLLCEDSRRIKRCFDIAIALAMITVAIPLAIVIILAIRVDSHGPVLFAHTRIGRDRRRFRVWKFRTMVMDGDTVLQRHFAANPAAALEWQFAHKLKNDPRVTRVGRFLRQTSLDELPQLWNVLRGDMSIVGPRPIVDEEVHKYGPAFRLYTQVQPGLTGLWQVSGRNDTTYRRRVELDSEYVRRWTLGLDIRLLFKTVRVLLARTGAY